MLNTRQLSTALLVLTLVWLAGCSNMEDQPKLDEPYGESPTFGQAARNILPEAVPVQFDAENAHYYTGRIDGELADSLPVELTQELLATGQENFNSFCSPCHGLDGYGEGIIALEGYPQPASYHTDELRAQPVGYIFEVISQGFGNMYSYKGRIPVGDRWAIAAYVRTMQYSQYAALDDLPPEARASVEAQSR